MLSKTYNGYQLHEADTYNGQERVAWYDADVNGLTERRFAYDTHYIDFSDHKIKVLTSANVRDHTIVPIIWPDSRTGFTKLIMYFKTDEEMMMAILKYPELFIEFERFDI